MKCYKIAVMWDRVGMGESEDPTRPNCHMRIEKRIYRVFSRGRRYTLPLLVCIDVDVRKKVMARRKKRE